MKRLIQILALLGAAYFAWDFVFVKKQLALPERPRFEKQEGAEPRREPGRGLNPFVAESDHAAPPQRPPMPGIPGQ